MANTVQSDRDNLQMDVRAMIQDVHAAWKETPQANAPIQEKSAQIVVPDVPTFTWGGYWHGIGIMFVLLAFLWFLARLVKRYARFPFLPRQGSLPKDTFFMEAQLPLGPRKYLMVVRFLNKRLLLGVTDQQIALLTEERVHDGVEESDFAAYIDEREQSAAK